MDIEPKNPTCVWNEMNNCKCGKDIFRILILDFLAVIYKRDTICSHFYEAPLNYFIPY